MRKIVQCLLFFYHIFIVLSVSSAENSDIKHGEDIIIQNFYNGTDSWALTKGITKFNAGPMIGDILNAHYFPGLLDYSRGNYIGAIKEMDYCLNRPHYININPRGYKYLSYAHYIRGMIYFYHASGHGRYTRAKNDFEQSIGRDPENYYAYLELSRVHAAVGSKEQAVTVLKQLMGLKPPEKVTQQAKKELSLLETGK